MSESFLVRNGSDVEIFLLAFVNAATAFLRPGETSEEQTVRFYNNGDTTPSQLRVGVFTGALRYDQGTNAQGLELVTEQMIQAKEGAGAWTPAGGDFTVGGKYLSITVPAPGAYTEILFKAVIPNDVTTRGSLFFFPFVAAYD